jgi:hypothetical protein
MNQYWRFSRTSIVAAIRFSLWSRSARAWGIGAGALLVFLLLSPSPRGELIIQRVEFRSDGLLELDFSGDPSSYYRLLSGTEVNRIHEVVDLSLEPPLFAVPEGEPARFYRVQRIPREASLDTDAAGAEERTGLLILIGPILGDIRDMKTLQHTIKAVIRQGNESGYIAECIEMRE